jgi:hypothetical protein
MSYRQMGTAFLEKLKRLPPRLSLALFSYGVLVLVGLYVLLPARTREERFLLALFLAVFAILAVKTIVHSKD